MRIAILVVVTLLAFAANSVLCRLALLRTGIDPASFTAIRLISGAAMLAVLMRLQQRKATGSWRAAGVLFVYAAAFSFAYLSLAAGTGALLLFGAVQATMILGGRLRGERLVKIQTIGLVAALAGLVVLVAPGVAAPPPASATLMIVAGCAWGVYSMLGRGAGDPAAATAGNFLRAVPAAILLATVLHGQLHPTMPGSVYAALSGAITSALGYILWYRVLPSLSAAQAASLQLSVPVITALGGAVLLGETVTLRLMAASVAVLGGIGLVIAGRRR